MENEKQQIIVAENLVAGKIYYIRDRRVILDRDLAELYEVETKVLNQSVRRNIERFPDAFMFQLTSSEFEILKSQIVTSSWGGTRKLPFAFTGCCHVIKCSKKQKSHTSKHPDYVGLLKSSGIFC